MKILHTMIRVKDLDASIRFYCDTLGMQLLRKKDYPSGRFTLAFVGYGAESEGAVLELTYNWDTINTIWEMLWAPCGRRGGHLPDSADLRARGARSCASRVQ